jgi:two-component system, OmpR family, alkaline phosphatase synthesis response regulator PhoP
MDRVLVIDDDPAIHRVLRKTFESSGFELAAARDGHAALDVFRAEAPRVVILELRLPGMSGPDLCREIRSRSSTVPILVLSSASDEFDKVLLLELGADDYITKPFSPRELLARVRAALRRVNQAPPPTEVFAFDDVVVNFLSMELFRAGKNVPVTPQEFRMLRFFANNQGRVISDSELLNEVWDNRSHPTTGTIKTHILRLRQKLERNPRKPLHFRTVHRAGYKFVV